MGEVRVVTTPSLEGKRRALVLVEDRIGHYPEFRAFFVRTFELDRMDLREPGYLAAPSGSEYALIFIGRSGEPNPAGVEIHALVAELEPFDEVAVEQDLWAILRWVVEGVGGVWPLPDLEATGRLFRIPTAMRGGDNQT